RQVFGIEEQRRRTARRGDAGPLVRGLEPAHRAQERRPALRGRVHHLGAGETGGEDRALQLGRIGHGVGVGNVGAHLGGRRQPRHQDVGVHQPPAGLEHAQRLAQERGAGIEVERRFHAQDVVERRVREIQAGRVHHPELAARRIVPRAFELEFGDVDADDLRGGEMAQQMAAGSAQAAGHIEDAAAAVGGRNELQQARDQVFGRLRLVLGRVGPEAEIVEVAGTVIGLDYGALHGGVVAVDHGSL
ncbi:hypothetical protein CATMIT_01973, partial [Catenibacterium mitsuokai DSM 15897]